MFCILGMMQDLALLSSSDILVVMHGAGAANALFLKDGASLVVVWPFEFGTNHRY